MITCLDRKFDIDTLAEKSAYFQIMKDTNLKKTTDYSHRGMPMVYLLLYIKNNVEPKRNILTIEEICEFLNMCDEFMISESFRYNIYMYSEIVKSLVMLKSTHFHNTIFSDNVYVMNSIFFNEIYKNMEFYIVIYCNMYVVDADADTITIVNKLLKNDNINDKIMLFHKYFDIRNYISKKYKHDKNYDDTKYDDLVKIFKVRPTDKCHVYVNTFHKKFYVFVERYAYSHV